MEAVIEQLLERPDFPVLAKQISRLAETEESKRAQFLRELTPEMKAEFILGQVVMHSPAKARHLVVTRKVFTAIVNYCDASGNGETFSEKCLISLTRNDFEPDIVWFSPAKAATITPDMMRFPAPDFIVEVLSPSTEAIDRGVKMIDYAAHGVGEYWIIDPEKQSVECYQLTEGQSEYSLRTEHHVTGTASPLCLPEVQIDLSKLF